MNQPDQEDRLSSLPDALLIHILSSIDTKFAVQSSILSKRWLHLWTLLPVLNFNSSLFQHHHTYHPHSPRKTKFHSFVDWVLANRNESVTIDAVNIKVIDQSTIARVVDYAFSRRVPSLTIDCSEYLTRYRPVSWFDSCDSLVSLTIKGMFVINKLELFPNLVSLRLERVKIVESEPFSCFPNLKELVLVNCKLGSELTVLEVIGFRLSRLTVFSCFYQPIPFEKLVLLTPELELLELDGLIPMSFEACELPLLDTVYIDCCFSFPRVADRNVFGQPGENQQKVNLINILWCLRTAKRVHLSPSTVQLLSLSQSMLDQVSSPFESLKLLNLIPPPNKPAGTLHSSVEAYLLKGSPGAVVGAFPR